MSETENGTTYYRDLVVNKTNHLTNLSNQWTQTCNSTTISIPDNIQGEIRCACGLAKLLIDERFNQFSDLIDQCDIIDTKENANKVLCSDLQGFWEMIYHQVVQVEKQFNNLSLLKANNYIVKESSPKLIATKKTIGLIGPEENKNKFNVKSKFAEFRKAQLEKLKTKDKKNLFEIKTTENEIIMSETSPNRYNLRSRPINKERNHVRVKKNNAQQLNLTPDARRTMSQLQNLSNSPLLKLAFISSQGKRESIGKRL